MAPKYEFIEEEYHQEGMRIVATVKVHSGGVDRIGTGNGGSPAQAVAGATISVTERFRVIECKRPPGRPIRARIVTCAGVLEGESPKMADGAYRIGAAYVAALNQQYRSAEEQSGVPAADVRGFRPPRVEDDWREGKFGGDPNRR